MKKLSVLFLSFVALATSVTSCSKDDNPAPPATALELTIKDQLGIAVQGATVTLYGTQTDYSNKTNPVGTAQTSDASGKVKFTNLESKVYYIRAEKADGCLDNSYTIPVTYDPVAMQQAPIAANKTTSLDIPVIAMGKITFTNNSTTDSYNVYLKSGQNDYEKLGKLAPGDAPYILVPTDTYDVKFVKLDTAGAEVSGSDVVKTGNAVDACGNVPVAIP